MNSKSFPFISIVCLTWNSKQDILDLLGSIYKASYPNNKLEVTVVDNASTDGTSEAIIKHFPHVKIIRNKKNLGMPGFNVGYKHARGKHIFSLQSDVTVAKNFFTTSVAYLEKNPEVGLLGVDVYDKKTKLPLYPTIQTNLLTGIFQGRPSKKARDFDYLEGLVHVFPKEIFKDVGFIDNFFYFYGDDPDFSFRIKEKGYQLNTIHNTYVLHGKSKTTPTYFSKKYHHYYKAVFRILYTFGSPLTQILGTCLMLTVIPSFQFIKERRLTFTERYWGFWENIKQAQTINYLLWFAIIVGFLFRIYAFFARDIWFDEAFTYIIARLPTSQVMPAVLTDNNPPLYYLLIHFLLRFNAHPLIMRIPSMVLNIISIDLIYLITRKISNRFTAKIATAIYLLSPLSVYMAITARLHTLGLFLVLVAVLVFIKLQEKFSYKKLFALTFILLLGIFTQYYFLLLITSFSIIVFLQKKIPLEWWILILAFISISFMPWMYHSMLMSHNGCSCLPGILAAITSLTTPMINGLGEITLRSFTQLSWYKLSILSAASLWGVWFAVKGLKKINHLIVGIFILP
ncbi:glycosyltransferase, partial [Candidatus Microgenomates bacterium]